MKCECGRQTNDPSGICAICRLKLNDPDTIQGSGIRGQKAQRHKVKKVKNNVPSSYVCIVCQKPYNPTSSAQKRCPTCKTIHIAEYQKKYKPSTDLQPHVARKKTHQSSNNCSVDGCKNPIKSSGMCNKHYLRHLKDAGRIGIRKNPKTSQVSRANLSARARGQDAEPERKQTSDRLQTLDKTKDVIPARAGIQSGNNGLFAQLLYASELLDRQIKLVSDNGAIDTKIILDIRMRLGAVLRGNE